ncbi:MAG TPA: hypothetical protein VGQ75_03395, partial [Thermoanaerobaculia bacterium]|nr:hypothetical protein [Thermoanaerobaculia bacterium]
ALLAIIAAGVAPHHHAILAVDSETRSEDVVTTHDPFSNASHWHAILKILPVDPCWACHWSRLSGLLRSATVAPPSFANWKLNALPPRSAISIARFTRRSRAPPDLS